MNKREEKGDEQERERGESKSLRVLGLLGLGKMRVLNSQDLGATLDVCQKPPCGSHHT